MRRILIIQTAFIGDAILTLPLIQQLKSMDKNSVVDVLAIPSTNEIFEASQYVDNVFVLEKKTKHKSLIPTLKFARVLKKNNYYHVISPHRSLRSSIITRIINAKFSTGFDTSTFSFLYKEKIEYQSANHEVQRNLSLLGLKHTPENWGIFPELNFTETIKNKVNNLLSNTSKKRIVIAPGSIWKTKKYPEEYYEKIAKYFLQKKYEIILIGGKGDLNTCKIIFEGLETKARNYCGELSLVESAYLISNVDLLICNDSAPTHLGMCTKTPVITLYCSTLPEFGFYPFNSNSKYLSFNELECKPCGIHGRLKCPIKTFDCGKKLLPKNVIETAEKLLK